MDHLERRIAALEIALAAIAPQLGEAARRAAEADIRGQAALTNDPAALEVIEMALGLIRLEDGDGVEADGAPPRVDGVELLEQIVDALVRDFAGPEASADQLEQLAVALVTKPSFLKIVGDAEMAADIAAIIRHRAILARDDDVAAG